MKSKRSKACDIPQKVKDAVWERDGHYCIHCGNPEAMPNAHYISRAHGGLGIVENIVTLCEKCHDIYDHTTRRLELREYIKNYLQRKHPGWDESNLVYKK